MSKELVTGISSGHLDWKTLEELFTRCQREWGFQVVEIWSEQVGYPPDRQTTAELRRLAVKHDMRLAYHAPLHGDYDLAHRDAARAGLVLREVLRVCGRIGIEFLVVHLGTNPARERGLRSAMSAFAQNRGLIVKQKTKIVIENVPTVWGDQVGDRVGDFEAVFRVVDQPWLGLCLDYGHASLNGNLFEILEKLGSRLMYTHVHDNRGEGDDHLGYGMGTIDWSKALRETLKLDFTGPFVIEFPEFHGRDKAERFLQTLATFYNERKIIARQEREKST